jgi:hypothetical protein
VALPFAAAFSFAATGLVVVPLADPGSEASLGSLTSWPEFGFAGVLFLAFALLAVWPRAVAAVAVGGAFAVCGALIAAQNVTTLIVTPQSAELQLLRSQLVEPRAPRRVVFVKPNWTDAAAPLVRYDEFGPPSTYFSWVPQPAVLLLLDGRAYPPIDVFPWDASTPPVEQGSGFVDMRTLDERRVDWTLWTLRAYRGD